ncbi:Rhodanese-like domain containing protein [Brugia malayi]|uniref:protein-tyrosine-phosphatase n=1 Tax=Brugia malayi TaxID=6279 RepID=A0A1P6C2I5_BRUMA|nr:Rhodanese-like domain containing protein [Brugia malayi]CTP81460.1 Bm4839, isoform b [Brugia malayi]VIO98108.1 Rhodanese-like domain containing protein [Brugia malayi]
MEKESLIEKFEFGSTDYSSNQTSEIFDRHIVRSSLLDLTNVLTPVVRSRPAAFHFLPLDHSSMENTSKYSKYSQIISPLNLSTPDKSSFSQITTGTPNKRCSSVSNESSSLGDHSRTRQLQCQRTQQRPAFKRLDRFKNVRGTSSRSSSDKLSNLFPTAITRFRAHLQGTSSNSLISPSLPSTSTPNKLESRYKKRRIPDETGSTDSAKRVKDDESAEESDNGRTDENFEEGMEIDMAEPSPASQDSAIEDESNLDDEGNISFPSAMFNRSHSSSFMETGDNKEPEPPSHLDVKYELDIIRNPDISSSAFACISAETLADLLRSMTKEQFAERFILIDCRYPFEFMGGHIRGAYNLFDPADVEAVFYPDNIRVRAQLMSKKPIFYCEFSQKRGPSIAYELRALDRKFNFERYPAVDYPEMYLLEYGYRNFYLCFSNEPDLIEPNGYVAMNDEAHIEELKNYKYHRIRTVASVYHTLARDRYNRQRKELNTSAMEVDVNMKTPTRMHPKHLFMSSPESPSQFPSTPKSRPIRDRKGDAPRRSTCRRLFSDDDFKGNDPGPGPSKDIIF